MLIFDYSLNNENDKFHSWIYWINENKSVQPLPFQCINLRSYSSIILKLKRIKICKNSFKKSELIGCKYTYFS